MSKKSLILLISAIVLAIAALSAVALYLWGPETETITVFVTTRGFGEQDITEEKALKIESGASVVDAFSIKYKDYYEAFGKPIVKGNQFIEFLGKKVSGTKATIRVYVNGVMKEDIEQEYLINGQSIEIVYNENK